jgi:hypothetical protein
LGGGLAKMLEEIFQKHSIETLRNIPEHIAEIHIIDHQEYLKLIDSKLEEDVLKKNEIEKTLDKLRAGSKLLGVIKKDQYWIYINCYNWGKKITQNKIVKWLENQ